MLRDTQTRAEETARLAPQARVDSFSELLVPLIESITASVDSLSERINAVGLTPEDYIECLRVRADMSGIRATLAIEEWKKDRDAREAAIDAMLPAKACPQPHACKAAAPAATAAAAAAAPQAKAAATATAPIPRPPAGPPPMRLRQGPYSSQ